MENEQILTAVVVIAVLAVVARVIINRQQKGGINWLKLGSIVALAVVFVVSMLSIDAYRFETWVGGQVEADELSASASHVVGRAPSDCTPVLNGLEGQVVPMFFALHADSVAPTGYWKKKRKEADSTVREEMVSKSDSSRTAIKHTTRGFDIMRHPDDESQYVDIYRLSTPSGEKVLALMTDYDAHAGVTPVGTAAALDGKMAQIAAADSTLNQNVYVSFFDTAHYTNGRTVLLAIAAVFAIVVTAVVGGLGRLAFYLWKKRQ